MNIPQSLIVGDTWGWTASYGDYPASVWTATAYFENAAESFTVTSSASGALHVFAETESNTAVLKKGSYFVQVRVTDGTDKHTVESGWCEVSPDPAGAASYDHRTWARRTLDAINAFLEGNATTAQASMSIGGKTLSRWSIAELTQWRRDLQAEVAAEDQASSLCHGRDIKVRFGRA